MAPMAIPPRPHSLPLTTATLNALTPGAPHPPARVLRTVLAPLNMVRFRRDGGTLLVLLHPVQTLPPHVDPLDLAQLAPAALFPPHTTRVRTPPARTRALQTALSLLREVAPRVRPCPYGCTSPQHLLPACPLGHVLRTGRVPLPSPLQTPPQTPPHDPTE